jgi:hypothetical protein
MLKNDRAPVKLVWPGGAPAGEGVFTDTGEYPNTYPKFFARYNRGEPLILPGTEGQGQGVRAQLVGAGRGEGHVETGLSPCLMRAAKDPNNKWKITEDDVSERKVTADGVRAIDLTLMDFMALYGAEGVGEAMALYGSGEFGGTGGGVPPRPGSPGSGTINAELETLRTALAGAKQEAQTLQVKLAESIKERETATKEAQALKTRMANLLSTLEARARGMKTAAGTSPRGQYQRALVKAAEGLEKTVADFRTEKAGA